MLRDPDARRAYDRAYKREKRAQAKMGTLVKRREKVELEEVLASAVDGEGMTQAEYLALKRQMATQLILAAQKAIASAKVLTVTQAMDFMQQGMKMMESVLGVEAQDDVPTLDFEAFLADEHGFARISAALLPHIGKRKGDDDGDSRSGPAEGASGLGSEADSGSPSGSLQPGEHGMETVSSLDAHRRKVATRRKRQNQAPSGVDASSARQERAD